MFSQLTTKEVIEQFNQLSQEIDVRVKNEKEQMLKPIFEDIFAKHEGLNAAVFIGYTPGFNDGEPCTHDLMLFVGSKLSYGYDFEDYADDIDHYFDYNEEKKSCSNDSCTTLTEAYKDINSYAEIINRIFETNFIVAITKDKEGKIQITKDWYDCGH